MRIYLDMCSLQLPLGNRSGGNQENELHGIGWNHYEQAVVIDFIANNSE
jgi:hypothetical protein